MWLARPLRLRHAALQQTVPEAAKELSDSLSVVVDEAADDEQDNDHVQQALRQLCQIDKEIHKIKAEHEHLALGAAGNEVARITYKEKLIQQMLSLDDVQSGGKRIVRKSRKVLVDYVGWLLDRVDKVEGTQSMAH